MDPITLGIGAIGLGMDIFGGLGAAKAAGQVQQDEQQKFQLQTQVNQQKQQQMELSARRQNLETFRNTQRARAQGINNAVSGGAQYGSGMPGGTADVQNQGMFANLGINQNLKIGENIFGLNNQITGINAQESATKATQATDQQWMSMGGQVMSNAGTIGKVGSTLGTGIANAGSSLSWLSGGATGFLG